MIGPEVHQVCLVRGSPARRALGLLLTATAALVLGLGVAWRAGPPAAPPAPPAPALVAMLNEPAKSDREWRSRFFRSMASLGVEVPLRAAAGLADVDEGYAVAVGPAGADYFVAVLRGSTPFLPGYDTQHLLLFDRRGTLLDALSCSISNRLTRMYADSGTFRTDVLGPGEDADLTMRYVPRKGERVAGNWTHEITHGGTRRRFFWDQDSPDALPSAEMESRGLCRVAVRGGKFVVVYPPP